MGITTAQQLALVVHHRMDTQIAMGFVFGPDVLRHLDRAVTDGRVDLVAKWDTLSQLVVADHGRCAQAWGRPTDPFLH